jgi:hypothetical protein
LAAMNLSEKIVMLHGPSSGPCCECWNQTTGAHPSERQFLLCPLGLRLAAAQTYSRSGPTIIWGQQIGFG